MKNLIFAAAVLLAVPAQVSAHCQVPCGIFDNDNVLSSLNTDWETITKASAQITELSKDQQANFHQITRWIMTKEDHCQAVQEKMLNYFLAQRVKMPEDEAGKKVYLEQLELCHAVIVTAMKCKQSTAPEHAEKLHNLLHDLNKHFGTPKEDKK